jgi:hypothetical protein
MKTYFWAYVACGFLYMGYAPFSEWADATVLPTAKAFFDSGWQKIPGYFAQGRLSVTKYYGLQDNDAADNE